MEQSAHHPGSPCFVGVGSNEQQQQQQQHEPPSQPTTLPNDFNALMETLAHETGLRQQQDSIPNYPPSPQPSLSTAHGAVVPPEPSSSSQEAGKNKRKGRPREYQPQWRPVDIKVEPNGGANGDGLNLPEDGGSSEERMRENKRLKRHRKAMRKKERKRLEEIEQRRRLDEEMAKNKDPLGMSSRGGDNDPGRVAAVWDKLNGAMTPSLRAMPTSEAGPSTADEVDRMCREACEIHDEARRLEELFGKVEARAEQFRQRYARAEELAIEKYGYHGDATGRRPDDLDGPIHEILANKARGAVREWEVTVGAPAQPDAHAVEISRSLENIEAEARQMVGGMPYGEWDSRMQGLTDRLWSMVDGMNKDPKHSPALRKKCFRLLEALVFRTYDRENRRNGRGLDDDDGGTATGVEHRNDSGPLLVFPPVNTGVGLECHPISRRQARYRELASAPAFQSYKLDDEIVHLTIRHDAWESRLRRVRSAGGSWSEADVREYGEALGKLVARLEELAISSGD